jgi:GDP-4-dehydro-6-deoxy-D-mannose reductase
LDGTLVIANAILEKLPDCCLINAGSGLIYGDSAKSGEPLDENALLAPVDEYGATKAAADLALGALAHRGLKCIRMRPFNHIGSGQSESFVVPAFAGQIARIEAGLSAPVMRVGNLDAERDFLDVRDVAAAYALAVKNADSIAPGTILNIASGKPRKISAILDALLSHTTVEIRVELDPARMRPSDLSCVVGNAKRARTLLDWEPEQPFETTLLDVLNDQRRRTKGD